MIADQAERELALNPSRSFIVQAPAGSGKTGLLVQRVLRLLSLVDRPESVVAVTFTRKAAAEMRSRVIDALNQAAHGREGSSDYGRKTLQLAAAVLKQDQLKHWDLRNHPRRLQIQTIDSLCASITRQMPVLSDLGGVGEVIEEPSELYLTAVRETLTKLAEGDDQDKALLRRIALHFDNVISRLESQMISMLGKRDQWEHLTPVNDAELVRDFCRMLRIAENQLRRVFQRAGKVDFPEIARAACFALGEPEKPSDLLYSLDFRLQHLLVDEFQDTSRTQYELIGALTEQWSSGDDHTLFLVGDPMQSIYRFREADVGLFLTCWDERRLGAVPLSPVTLRVNFRSTSRILHWVEEHVGRLMPEDNKEIGAVGFRKSESGREEPGDSPRIFALIEDSGSGEADEVIRIIRRNQDKKVGILVRSRSQTLHILPALRREGIAYQAVNIELLKDQQHIIDVLSLTRALVNSADRLSWLACLRAPWCGLTLADLCELAETHNNLVVFDVISDPGVIARLSPDGRWRIVRVQEILRHALSRLGRISLRALVEQTWQELGGPATLQEPHQIEDVKTLFGLLEEVEEGGLIRDFSLLEKKLELLYARANSSESHVALMTIFEAKGLEFDVVILPQLARGVRGHDKELLVWSEYQDENGNSQLALAALPQTGVEDDAYKEINDLAKERDEQESRRIFYVACTRAKDELHLIGSARRRKDGSPFVRSGTFLHFIWEQPDIQKEFAAKAQIKFERATQNKSMIPSNKVLLQRLPENWAAPKPAKDLSIRQPVRHATASDREIIYHWVGDSSRHVGIVVHEVLRRIAAEGLESWREHRILAAQPFFESELLRMGVPRAESAGAAKRVSQALTNTLKSERGRWILGPQLDARSEWAVRGFVDGVVVSGTIDRFFRDSSGMNWIVDFKTGPHAGGQTEEFLAKQERRYRSQLEQYAKVLSPLTPGPISLGLYFPLLEEWVEWEFADVLAANG